jgi:hypothetical protein
MKKITMVVQDGSVKEVLGKERELVLQGGANVIDAINEIDKIICEKGKFPNKYYSSLLHWVYDPIEKRFYEQVALNAYTPTQKFLNIRSDIKAEIPDGATIILKPEGGCISGREEPISYEKFREFYMK